MKATLKGFTLIELMLTVAIIGVISAIVLPKFAELTRKAQEAAVKGKLGSYRGAFRLYSADNDGNYPAIASQMIVGKKYLNEIPTISIPGQSDHIPNHKSCTSGCRDWDGDHSSDCWPNGACVAVIMPDNPMEMAYRYDATTAHLAVNCHHTDISGRVWSTH